MMFKLSIKLDVSLGKILLGISGCSVAVCAYKFYFATKDEQTTGFKSEVIDTIDQKQNISAKSDENGHGPSTLSSKQKPSLYVNNSEDNYTTILKVSKTSEVPDTNLNNSSMDMNTVDDEHQEPNLPTLEEKQCFQQSDVLEIKANQYVSSQSNVKDLVEPSLSIKDNVTSSVKSSAENSATETKQLSSSKIADFTPTDTKQNLSVKSSIKDPVEPYLNIKEVIPDSVKPSVDENKVKFEASKVDSTIKENHVISLEKPNTLKVLDKKLNKVDDKQQSILTGDNLANTSTLLSNKKNDSSKSINHVNSKNQTPESNKINQNSKSK